jgi:hypothetical protein
VKLSLETKRSLVRMANAILGVWLIVVLIAYFGVLKLPGVLADLAMLTVLVVIAQMIWKYALQPLFGAPRERP